MSIGIERERTLKDGTHIEFYENGVVRVRETPTSVASTVWLSPEEVRELKEIL